jgi:hypothetical protein
MATGDPRTPSPPLQPLRSLKVANLSPKLVKLAQYDDWFRQAVEAPVIKAFHVTSYPDPSSKDGGQETKDLQLPNEVAGLLKNNHENLHALLKRMREMMDAEDEILTAEAQNEFTRLQVCNSASSF